MTSSAFLSPSTRSVVAFLAICFAVAAVVLTCVWMALDIDASYLGGVNTNELLFNWHPILMVSGLIFSSITAILAYRFLPLEKTTVKYIHAFFHSASIVCVVLGVSAVFQSSNLLSKNLTGTYSNNLASLHSFLGLSALVCYGANYIIGVTSFLLYNWLGISEPTKAVILRFHLFLGTFSMFASVFAVETGVMELSTDIGVCDYPLTDPDLNPAQNYNLLPSGCQVANGIGITVFVAVALTYLAIFEHSKFPKPADVVEPDAMQLQLVTKI